MKVWLALLRSFWLQKALMSRVSLSCFDIGNLSQQSARYLLFFIAFLSVVTCNESAIECFLLLWWLALYGVLFTGQEVTGGFSNYRLWESTGFLISYILQVNVCVDAKLWILISTLAIGMTGYLTVEYMEQESKQSAKREVVDIQTWNKIENTFSFISSIHLVKCSTKVLCEMSRW